MSLKSTVISLPRVKIVLVDYLFLSKLSEPVAGFCFILQMCEWFNPFLVSPSTFWKCNNTFLEFPFNSHI